jgi:hypothetical protein
MLKAQYEFSMAFRLRQLLTKVIECITALAPTVVSCAAALAEAGLNVIADAACIATLANSSINPVSI